MRPLFAFLMALTLVSAFGAPKKLVCPVTHLSVPSPETAAGKGVYKGKTYYFCTSYCKRLFEKNPKKYAK